MMFHGMWKNAQETEPTVLNYSYAGANTRNNNVQILSCYGIKTNGDSFFTLVRSLLIFYCDENGSLNEIFGLELNVWT